tara:strand:+ start:552 stop:1076 length:525 start_codon:yes stop_codon:yes gene_type:complete
MGEILNCCNTTVRRGRCIKTNGKIYNIKSKYTRKKCRKINNNNKYCKPFKNCSKKEFLYNPNNPSKSYDVYIDKDPSDTINIKYTTIQDVKNTIQKLEKLYKTDKYSHKRIWQVGMIMKVRLEAMLKHKNSLYKKAKNVKQRYNLANRYFLFLRKRTKTELSKRKQLTFKLEQT